MLITKPIVFQRVYAIEIKKFIKISREIKISFKITETRSQKLEVEAKETRGIPRKRIFCSLGFIRL